MNKIRSKKFLDLKELLQDNMSLVAQLEELQGPTSLHVVGATQPRMREITSLPTWCHCFLAYTAAMTSDPATRDQLAYARLIIQQAQHQNGLGWMDYDKAFRQQMAADPTSRLQENKMYYSAHTLTGLLDTTVPTKRVLTFTPPLLTLQTRSGN